MPSKVSIVVPIYKVEKYLRRCVDSIINQTYRNLEIILVDDGSPDKCGQIIDEYKEKDSRIISLHKKNGGLSDARNYGMKYVTGEYIFFLDSDDYIKSETIETLINLSLKYQADIVQGGFYYKYENYLLYDDRYYKEDSDPIILDNKELMYELIVNERVKNFAWGKLYKTDLIKDLLFEKGVLFEDVFWAHNVMSRVKKYVICHKPLTYYVQREDSIVANYSVRNLDIIKGMKVRHKFIEENYSEFIDESYTLLIKTMFIHYNLLLKNKDKDPEKKYRREIEEYILINYNKIMKAINANKELRRQLLLFKIYPNLNRVIVIYYKLLRKVHLLKKEMPLKMIKDDKFLLEDSEI